MRSQLLKAKDHHQYLDQMLSTPEYGRGAKTKLAEALRCRSAFISQVIAGKNSLTLEMALVASQFFNHLEAETKYFLLMVERDRAGTAPLKRWFDQELSRVRDQYKRVESRVSGDLFASNDAAIYYSQWWYVAIHIICGTPGNHTASSIARRVYLPLDLVQEVLSFLEKQKFVELKNGFYVIGKRRLHAPENSQHVNQHHANWRLKSAALPVDKSFKPMRYTGVLAYSFADAEIVRETLLAAIERCEQTLLKTNEEDAFALMIDFSRL